MTSYFASAPATVQGVHDGHVIGSATLSGMALLCAVLLLLGIRKADRVKVIHTRDGIGALAIVTGTVWIAAGSSWAGAALGIGSVTASVIGPGSGLGNPGEGIVALVLTILTFAPRWKRTIYPAFFGIAAAATYGTAGGIWGVLVNAIRLVVGHFTGGA